MTVVVVVVVVLPVVGATGVGLIVWGWVVEVVVVGLVVEVLEDEDTEVAGWEETVGEVEVLAMGAVDVEVVDEVEPLLAGIQSTFLAVGWTVVGWVVLLDVAVGWTEVGCVVLEVELVDVVCVPGVITGWTVIGWVLLLVVVVVVDEE